MSQSSSWSVRRCCGGFLLWQLSEWCLQWCCSSKVVVGPYLERKSLSNKFPTIGWDCWGDWSELWLCSSSSSEFMSKSLIRESSELLGNENVLFMNLTYCLNEASYFCFQLSSTFCILSHFRLGAFVLPDSDLVWTILRFLVVLVTLCKDVSKFVRVFIVLGQVGWSFCSTFFFFFFFGGNLVLVSWQASFHP